jgi:3-oxoacyl-[acyl-carrier-protein] synthase II
VGTEECWTALRQGRSGIGPISRFDTSGFPCRIAGEVSDFDPLEFVSRKDVRKMGRFIFFALAASEFAMRMSGLEVTSAMSARVGVYVGSGIGGFDIIEREHAKLLKSGPRRVTPFFIPSTIVNLASGQVSIRWNAKGPNSATATACTSGAHAVGDSFRLIQNGYADAMICGGTEAAITPMSIAGFGAMKALSTRNDDPVIASRPWDADRDGFVVGEGAGILVLEALDSAVRRDAPILAEMVGYGMSGDAFHITSPAEDGDGAMRVMRNAIDDAGVSLSDVDYINSHGTSTPVGDVIESRAMERLFGDHAKNLAVSSTKSMTGHLLGGAGGLEAGIATLAIRDQIAPPTINLDRPGPGCNLDYVANEARSMEIEYSLSNSFGFGGTNGALLFRRYRGR